MSFQELTLLRRRNEDNNPQERARLARPRLPLYNATISVPLTVSAEAAQIFLEHVCEKGTAGSCRRWGQFDRLDHVDRQALVSCDKRGADELARRFGLRISRSCMAG